MLDCAASVGSSPWRFKMKLFRVKVMLPTGELRVTIVADWTPELAVQHVLSDIGECHFIYSREEY
jgi:hypothetical protein